MSEAILTGVLVGPFVVYLVARFATAAYFKSKQHYEQRNRDDSTTRG